MLVAVQSRVQVILEGEGRGFCVPARGLDCTPAPFGPADLFGVLRGVHSLHDALKPDIVQIRVKGRSRCCEVMAQVGPAEVFQIKRPQHPPEALGSRQGCPCLVLLQELCAFVREIAGPDNVFEKKGPLLLPVCQRRAVALIIQLVDETAEVNRRQPPPPSLWPLLARPGAGRRGPDTASPSPEALSPSGRRPAPPSASSPAGPAARMWRSGPGRR